MMSLAVPCGSNPPNKKEYNERLCDYVQALIQADPQMARSATDCFSSCSSLRNLPMKDWAYQISYCDEMNLLLAEIDWERENPPESYLTKRNSRAFRIF